MKLTPHFTYNEMIKSDTANAKGIDNTPSAIELSKLTTLCWKVLEPAREQLGASIYVTSGFRSIQLNRAVRSKDTSQHIKGEASDITCNNNIKLFKIIFDLDFDQLILEKPNENGYPEWLHVSYTVEGHNRNQVLVYDEGKYTAFKLWVSSKQLESVLYG
jgi:D-alanyl-D-alanine dipeptidase